MSQDSPYLSPNQLAERHHTGVAHLANLRAQGRGVAYVKVGAKVLYALTDVEAYEEANRVEPGSAA